MNTPLENRGNIVDQQEEEAKDDERRNRTIVRTSVIGILTNVALAAFKAIVGFFSHSIAIVMDAVNNLSDAASSIVTIVGAKLASRKPDKKHPFGHRRVEYFSALIIAILVLYAGLTSLVESVKKIINPDVPDYSPVTLIIISVAVIVKILLGSYFKKIGKKVHSDSLVNSGQDALMDSVISASTLLAAAIFLLFNVSLEAWLGAVISILIIKSGVDMLRETISQLLGERGDVELARDIKSTVLSFPDVSGAYDLVLNNYGPDTYNGSIHIEVPDTYSAADLDELIRSITVEVYRKHRVVLTAIGVYSVNTRDERVAEMRETIRKAVLSVKYVLQMHGFFVQEDRKTIRFDAVVSFDAPDRGAVYREVCEKVNQLYPDYTLQITLDSDFTEE